MPPVLPDAISRETPPLHSYAAVEASMELPENMQRILDTLGSVLTHDYGILAVRFGDEFSIHAVSKLPMTFVSASYLVENGSEVAQSIESHRVMVIQQGRPFETGSEKLPECTWLIAPIIIGQRVTGVLVFGREDGFSSAELEMAGALGAHIAPSVEKSILSVEAAYYLQRFALLNELAGLASSGLQLHEVTQRAEEMLKRAFGASRVKMLLLDERNDSFIEYVSDSEGRSIKRAVVGSPLEK
ncbi:MAG: GAF domain-containing protein, partial [Anaerolineales bacterium]